MQGCSVFHLPRNFYFPYFSPNLGEFWRRWHITLSTWLRDYVYFPLGGSRQSDAKTYRNLMITFGLNGLWHGAAWGFVVWGVGNGLGVCIYRAWTQKPALENPHPFRISLPSPWSSPSSYFVRVPFRTPDLVSALDMYGMMFGIVTAGTTTLPLSIEPLLLALIFVHWIFYQLPRLRDDPEPCRRVVFASGMGVATALALGVLPVGYSPFIYFQF